MKKDRNLFPYKYGIEAELIVNKIRDYLKKEASSEKEVDRGLSLTRLIRKTISLEKNSEFEKTIALVVLFGSFIQNVNINVEKRHKIKISRGK